jgi:hypothetical protein
MLLEICFSCLKLRKHFARKHGHVILVGVHQHIFEKSNMFNSFLSLQNLFSSNGLVNISVSWSFVPTLSMQMSLLCLWSLMKWWRTLMCFVFAFWTGLLVSLIVIEQPNLYMFKYDCPRLTHWRAHTFTYINLVVRRVSRRTLVNQLHNQDRMIKQIHITYMEL